MNKVITALFTRRIYILLALAWLAMSTTSCTYTYYTPSGTTSFTGTTTYCQGATASANTLHYSECSSGTGTTASGVSCTVQWYYNTTGSTTPGTSTALGSSTVFTSASSGAGTLSYTPLTTTAGTFYYFAYITWGSGYCASPFTSTTQTITINPSAVPITGTPTVCIGSTTALTETVSGGTWSSGSSGVATVNSSGMVTGISTGTVVVSYATTCNTVTATVTVKGPPAAIAGPSAVCPGSTMTLTNTTPGGTWSSGSTAYASINSISGIVSGIAPGSTLITYTTGCGAPATATITVNPLPAAITGTDSVCANGATTTLSDITGGGSWSSSPAAIATVNGSGTVTGLTAGSVIITYTSPLNCTATFGMTVDPLPAPITGTLHECVGSTTALSDAVPGGTWSSSNPFFASVDPVTGVVTGLISATTFITYTNNCGSVSASNYTQPLPGPIGGRDSVCQLSDQLLTDIYAGGSWSSSNTAIASVAVPTSGSITGVAGGTADITYTLPTGCYISVPFVVVPLPVPITGALQTCPGATVSLLEATPGGTWSIDDSAVATVGANTGLLTGIYPDTATVTYTMPIGCHISTIILVNPLPAPITGIVASCTGTPDTLSDDSTGGVWSTGSSAIATISATGVLTTISAGTATITYTLPATGCMQTATETVYPLPVPVITFIPDISTFTTNDIYVSYQWFSSLSGIDYDSIPGAISYNLAALYNEYYLVRVTDDNGCTSRSAPYHMIDLGVNGINNANSIDINPNPTTGMIHIASPVNVRAVISDVSGKVFMEQSAAKNMDIHTLPSGIYMIALFDDSGNRLLLQKLVKQ